MNNKERRKLHDKRKVAGQEESCMINRKEDRQTVRSTRSRFSCLIQGFLYQLTTNFAERRESGSGVWFWFFLVLNTYKRSVLYRFWFYRIKQHWFYFGICSQKIILKPSVPNRLSSSEDHAIFNFTCLPETSSTEMTY